MISSKLEVAGVMTQAFDTSARVSKHLTCGLVLCMHVEDAIGVHVEADVDLGNPPRRRGDPSNLPSRLLSRVRLRSPSYTWISTPGWLSEYVLKVCMSSKCSISLRRILLQNTDYLITG